MSGKYCRLALLLLTTLLAACSTTADRGDHLRYDLGFSVAGERDSGVSTVEVIAPSWLATDAIEYRLAYADAAQRREYADNRWVASPVELLHLFLQRRLAGGGACRLRLDLDEFLQVFDSPQASRQIMAVRASLSLGTTVADRGSFVIEQQATTPDARGSVAAASLATGQLADQLATWLAQRRETCRPTPADH